MPKIEVEELKNLLLRITELKETIRVLRQKLDYSTALNDRLIDDNNILKLENDRYAAYIRSKKA